MKMYQFSPPDRFEQIENFLLPISDEIEESIFRCGFEKSPHIIGSPQIYSSGIELYMSRENEAWDMLVLFWLEDLLFPVVMKTFSDLLLFLKFAFPMLEADMRIMLIQDAHNFLLELKEERFGLQ